MLKHNKNIKTFLFSFVSLFITMTISIADVQINTTSSIKENNLNITIVYDNNSYDKRLETRWGFSCLVEGLEKTILFDVGGDGTVLLRNMAKLKIDPKKIDVVILSHVHTDHIGGLTELLRENPSVTVYMPKSLPQRIKERVKNVQAALVEVHDSTKICKNAYSTGELGLWIKEESLVIQTIKGLIIITGCAHPGIINIIKKAKTMFKSNLYLVLGGFHLCSMSEIKIKGLVNVIKNEKVKKVAPCHCSGDDARKLFKNIYKDNFILAGCGKTITIKDAFPFSQNH